jgi:hypothetical protein
MSEALCDVVIKDLVHNYVQVTKILNDLVTAYEREMFDTKLAEEYRAAKKWLARNEQEMEEEK